MSIHGTAGAQWKIVICNDVNIFFALGAIDLVRTQPRGEVQTIVRTLLMYRERG